MRKIILVFAISAVFASCEKVREFEPFDKKDKPCARVQEENLPVDVKNTFREKYKEAVEITWFDKDEKAYVATFELNGKDVKATFEKNGSFVKERGEDDDDEKEKGCSCDEEGG